MTKFTFRNQVFISPYALIATVFGSGLLNPGPGTWGSLASIPICYTLFFIFGFNYFLLLYVLLFAVGTYAAHRYDQSNESHDNKAIVIDELVGQWLALIPVLYVYPHNTVFLSIAAFCLFRFFDILKPWPISVIDKHMPGVWGVMLDDVAAGLVAAGLISGFLLWMH